MYWRQEANATLGGLSVWNFAVLYLGLFTAAYAPRLTILSLNNVILAAVLKTFGVLSEKINSITRDKHEKAHLSI